MKNKNADPKLTLEERIKALLYVVADCGRNDHFISREYINECLIRILNDDMVFHPLIAKTILELRTK